MNTAIERAVLPILQQRQTSNLVRKRKLNHFAEPILNFSSNDYLALAGDSELTLIYQQAFSEKSHASTGSALISGYHQAHQILEQRFAEFLGLESALFFPSGYQANLAIVDAFSGIEGVTWLLDKQSHASMYHALSHSSTNISRFKHHDIEHFRFVSEQNNSAGVCLAYLEGVNSMTGHIAALNDYITSCDGLIIDDAHALGVLGSRGRGSIDFHQLNSDKITAIVCPLGKAFAGHGAIVAASQVIIEQIIQFARPYIYSTAPSPALAQALTESLAYIQSLDSKRAYLQQLINYFIEQQQRVPGSFSQSKTMIQQYRLANVTEALALSEFLSHRGITCVAMRPPTVPNKQTGLRISLSCHHTPQMIDLLFDTVEEFHHAS